MSDVRPTNCPYCSEPAIFDERKSVILCEHCDVEYKVTKQGGAKVKKTGIFDDHENRLQALEQRSPVAAAAQPGGNEELDDPEDTEDPKENGGDEEIFPE